MWHLEVNAPSLDAAVKDLSATQTQVRRALNTTMGKMAVWLRTRAMRGLSEELQIQQKVMRRRLKTFRLRHSSSGSEITVWFGLNQIALIYLGARETKTGVTAGAHVRKGAFIAKGRGGNMQVFKRTSKSRLPIEKQTLPIEDKANVYIQDNLIGTDEFDVQFFKIFEHELQWQVSR